MRKKLLEDLENAAAEGPQGATEHLRKFGVRKEETTQPSNRHHRTVVARAGNGNPSGRGKPRPNPVLRTRGPALERSDAHNEGQSVSLCTP